MKRVVAAIWFLFYSSIPRVQAVAATDALSFSVGDSVVVYLKDQTILRGKVTGANETSFTVESESAWKVVRRNEVEKLRVENQPQGQEISPKNPDASLAGLVGGIIVTLAVIYMSSLIYNANHPSR